MSVVDILAVIGVRYGIITCFDAELAASEEVVPVVDLGNGFVVFCGRQVVRKHETAEWVPSQISAVGVKLASGITSRQTKGGLIYETRELNVSGRLDELNSGESSGGDKASTMAFFGAICYDLSFDVANHAVWCRRTPQTEIINRVNEHGLTH